MLKVKDEGETRDKIHADTLHTEEQIKIVDFLSEITQERRHWHNIFKVLKVKICEPKNMWTSISNKTIFQKVLFEGPTWSMKGYNITWQ